MATSRKTSRKAQEVDGAALPSRNGAQPVSSPNAHAKAAEPGDAANDANAAAAAGAATPTIVRITASGPARVVQERVADRERHENGVTPLEPNVEAVFIVRGNQSLRVVDGAD